MTRKIVVLLGTVFLVYLLWRLGPGEIVQMLGQMGRHSLPILVFFAVYQAARAAALRLSVPQPGLLGYRDALWIRFSGEAVQSLTFTGPFLAEPTKAWLLGRRGLTLREGFAATITEYLVCTLVAAMMSVAALVYLKQHVELTSAVAGVATGLIWGMSVFLIASAIAILLRFYLIGSVIAGLARLGLLRGRLRPDIGWINRMEDLLLAVLRDRPARFGAIALVEAGAQAFLVLEVFWVLHALDMVVPAVYPLLIEAATKFISIAFFFIPMQMGAAEGTYAVIFDALGLPATAGFTLAFMRRLRTLIVAGAGLAALGRLMRPRR